MVLRAVVFALLLACGGGLATAADEPPRREPAPEFRDGLEWFNTERPLSLRELRGKFVLLDFWTYCCINCMHILPELSKLEAAFPDELVVIGVHSAKFPEERLGDNIREAMLRYRIRHPVVNDADHAIWTSYGVDTWPSFRVIDPEGNVIASEKGELEFEAMERFFRTAIEQYRGRGSLKPSATVFRQERLAASPALRFPGKVIFDEATRRLFVADSGHDRIVIADVAIDGGRIVAKLADVIGSGKTGASDGTFEAAAFNQPQGMALDAAGGSPSLWIADTDNHLLRRAALGARTVETVAGTGRQGRAPVVGMPAARGTPLNSPWDLSIEAGQLFIAMAGPHQIWRMPLAGGQIGPYAGNGREDIVDGALLPRQPFGQAASFAQPSGLAAHDGWLYVADSEGSSIRAVPLPPAAGRPGAAASRRVRTVVGTSRLSRGRLFTFGDVDGPAKDARLQHPLGVAWHDGSLFVVDTYNNKVKRVDPSSGATETVSGSGRRGARDDPPEFDEPAGIAAGGGMLWIADTNNHAIRTVDPGTGATRTITIAGLEPPSHIERHADREPAPAMPGGPLAGFGAVRNASLGEVRLPATEASGSRSARLRIAVAPPDGWKLNDMTPLRWRLALDGPAGPVDAAAIERLAGKETGGSFEIALPLASDAGTARLVLSIDAILCEAAGTTCRPSAGNATLTLVIDAAATSRPVQVTLP